MLVLQPGRAGWLELILSFVSVVIFHASATRSLRSVTVCSGLLAYRTIVRERVPRHHAMFSGRDRAVLHIIMQRQTQACGGTKGAANRVTGWLSR
jgi:hypothetical protein